MTRPRPFQFRRAGRAATQPRPDQARARCLEITEREHQLRMETMKKEKEAWEETIGAMKAEREFWEARKQLLTGGDLRGAAQGTNDRPNFQLWQPFSRP